MLSLKNRFRLFLYMCTLLAEDILTSTATNQLARTVLNLAQIHLTVMLIFVIVSSPLPVKPTLSDVLVFWSGSYAGALGVYKLFQLIRRPTVRAHWITSQH